MSAVEDVREAAELVNFGLHFKAKPTDSKEYAKRYDRYRNDPDFAQVVRSIAEGQQLSILETDSDDSGLVLVPSSPDSLYAFSLEDLRALALDKRQVLALTLCVITKIFFPSEQSLHSTDSSRVAIAFSTILSELQRLAQSYGSIEPTDERILDVSDGWALLARLTVKTDKEKIANTKTMTGYLRLALNKLTEGGLIRAHGVDKNSDLAGSYIATHRFQLQVREIALPAWFEIIREARAAADKAPAAVKPISAKSETAAEASPDSTSTSVPDPISVATPAPVSSAAVPAANQMTLL
jgi:hypothetical protein